MTAKRVVLVEVVSGAEGPCLCISEEDGCGTRVAGPKPWGGGRTIHSFRVDVAELLEAIEENAWEAA